MKTKENESKYEKLINKSRYLLKEGNMNKLDKFFHDYLNECYEDPALFMEYGNYLIKAKQFKKAQEVFLKIIFDKTSDMYYAYYNLAKCYNALGMYDQAIKNLRVITDSNYNKKMPAYLLLAKTHIQNKDYKFATSILEKLKEEDNVDFKFKASMELFKMYMLLKRQKLAYKELNSIDYNLSEKQKYQLSLNKINVLLELHKTEEENIDEISKLDEIEKLLSFCEKSEYYNYEDICIFQIKMYMKKNEYSKAVYKMLDAKSHIKNKKRIMEIDKLLFSCFLNNLQIEDAKKVLNMIEESESNEDRNIYKQKIFIYENSKEFDKLKNYLYYLLDNPFVDEVFVYLRLCSYYIKNKEYLKAKEIVDYLQKKYSYFSSAAYHDIEVAKTYLNNNIGTSYNVDNKIINTTILSSLTRETVLEHISKEQSKFDKVLNTENSNLIYLYKYAQETISDETCKSANMIEEHIIDFPTCCIYVDHNVDKIKVKATINTRDIIAMYPVKIEKLPSIEDRSYTSSKLVKIPTQIDKFDKYKL